MTNANPHTGPQAQHAPAAQTVFFGIPLKARAVSKNWDWTVRDFNRTLASIYNQTNPNFRILVGCHDIPELLIPTDERLEFLSVDRPIHSGRNEGALYQDKSAKLERIAESFRECEGEWFMTLDADDLVSTQLVQFILTHSNPNGFIVRRGYIFDQLHRIVAEVPHPEIFKWPFDKGCGSCAIIRLAASDLKAEDNNFENSRLSRYIIKANHTELYENSIRDGRPLSPLPFLAVTYVVNTGENHSFVYGRFKWSRQNELLPALNKYGEAANVTFRNEFGVTNELWNA
jgi:hypothetical protein